MDNKLHHIVQKQKEFFLSHQTLDINFRKAALKKMLHLLVKYESDILDALKKDLKKAKVEAFGADIHPLMTDIKYLIKNLHQLAKPKKVKTPLILQPGRAEIQKHPYGVCLVIGPFNYPFDLSLTPACGAIAAGNTVIIKPSEFTPHSSALIHKMIADHFDDKYIYVAEGGADIAQELTQQDLDFIFFTGSANIGKKVMEQASKRLTPIGLELGGKCPCIIDKDCNITVSAQRITWAKVFNAGQSCVAPDFLVVHEDIKEAFMAELCKTIDRQMPNYADNPDYARIINQNHFDRISRLMKDESIRYGGNQNPEQLLIEPTILDEINWESPCMQEEIFGPLFPILTYNDLDDLINRLNRMEKPLALYFFSSDQDKADKVIIHSNAGGVSINDAMAHVQNRNLPFGGIGTSGMGYYHGKYTFNCFSHQKAVQKRSWIDIKFKYPPYKGKFALLKRILPFVTK